jgi:hypothetical protein
VQGASIYFQLYKSIVASFNLACWCSIMSESNDSDSAESVDGGKDESRMRVDKTESGHGKTREEHCNLISPPSNERDDGLNPEIVQARAKMMDVYCIKDSAMSDLYNGHNSYKQNKRSKDHFRKVVGAYLLSFPYNYLASGTLSCPVSPRWFRLWKMLDSMTCGNTE